MIQRPLLVRQAMNAAPLELPATTTIKTACIALRSRRVKELLVVRSLKNSGTADGVVGILTESDAIDLLARDLSPTQLPLSEVMSSPVETIHPDRTLDDAYFLMRTLRVHRLPVVAGGRVLGLLTRDGLLEAQNQRLRELRQLTARLESEALHDSLTGLANRRLFDEALEREVAQHERTKRSLGLLMIDIDFFKLVNDNYGHPRGDLLLRQLAERLKTRVRRSDLLARFGGEEFAVIATVPDRDQLLALAEQLREVVESHPFEADPAPSSDSGHDLRIEGPESAANAYIEQVDLNVTISIGAAMLGEATRTGKRLIKAADAALYQAKAAGRNCVRFGEYRPSNATA